MINDIRKLLEITEKEGLVGGFKSIIRYVIFKPRVRKILRWKFELEHGQGINVMEHDWDNLIILDACRYDIFKKYTRFEGKLSKVVSAGYYSWEFIEANFVGKELHDTIYITANPYSSKLDGSVFFKIINLIDKWDDQTGTVLPGVVTRKALEVAVEYPDKRLIIHYMQPHAPYIGSVQSEFMQQGISTEMKEGVWIFDAVREGIINSEMLLKSYVENLQIVEKSVEFLISNLGGKTVISSDHGENLGEYLMGTEIFGHKLETPECRFVPWLELDYESRREVIASEPVSDVRPGGSTIDNRLRDLGYL
jgi:hypothetical protein